MLQRVTQVINKAAACRTVSWRQFNIKGCVAIADIFSSAVHGIFFANAVLISNGVALVSQQGPVCGLVGNQERAGEDISRGVIQLEAGDTTLRLDSVEARRALFECAETKALGIP